MSDTTFSRPHPRPSCVPQVLPPEDSQPEEIPRPPSPLESKLKRWLERNETTPIVWADNREDGPLPLKRQRTIRPKTSQICAMSQTLQHEDHGVMDVVCFATRRAISVFNRKLRLRLEDDIIRDMFISHLTACECEPCSNALIHCLAPARTWNQPTGRRNKIGRIAPSLIQPSPEHFESSAPSPDMVDIL